MGLPRFPANAAHAGGDFSECAAMKTIRERFWSKVRIPENVTDEDCWDWVGMMGHHNYGRMIASGRVQFAHRDSGDRFSAIKIQSLPKITITIE